VKPYLVAYDIFDAKRLRRVKKVVDGYRLKGQKSSWETPLNRTLTRALVDELSREIEKEDRVNLIALVGSPILLGKARSIEHQDGGVVIV
jgi:CRISPR-associated endonuclease Cas2